MSVIDTAHGDRDRTRRETRASGTHRVVVERVAPRGPGVVDEDVQRALALAELGDEVVDLLEPLHVCGDRDARPGPERVQLLLCRGAVFGGPRRDVHL